MKTYSRLPCPLLPIVVDVGRSTVASRTQSVDWDITVDVMGDNSLIEKIIMSSQSKIKMGRNQILPFPCRYCFLLLFGWGGWGLR